MREICFGYRSVSLFLFFFMIREEVFFINLFSVVFKEIWYNNEDLLFEVCIECI